MKLDSVFELRPKVLKCVKMFQNYDIRVQRFEESSSKHTFEILQKN